MRLVEMVPMLDERTVVYRMLRKQVLGTLHSSHQGVLAMGLRAKQVVYWSSFQAENEETRAK